MKVILFGRSGFIGRHVRAALAADPRVAEVRCPGRDECDLAAVAVDELTAMMDRERPAAVVNCTGRVAGTGPELLRANAEVTAKLIEAIAAAAPRARLVRMGSAAEFGLVPTDRAVTEDDPALPVSEYGLSQFAGTRLLELACAAGRIDGVALRVFNPLGAGLPEANLLGRAAAVIRRAQRLGDTEITLGPLSAYRDFVDVRDLAAAVVAAVCAGPLPARVFNVGSGRTVASREAVRLLAEAAGFTGRIREEEAPPARSAAVPWIQADISRARRLLGWSPEHDLASSVKAVLAGTEG
ncbi:NAD-dependent epimerase/dehydratase family protein [Plantactinospora siamensis]|uniref:NAD-dependent epimerase/dehydratase family protein n=1 Tax=Plantactinospora siamensis TaxID=555372 RepID=A0ABV6P6B1_9ACTN